jgi:rhodanese-related sulfurtransferase
MAAPDSAEALAAARTTAFVIDLRDEGEKHEGACERAHAIPWSSWGKDGIDGGKVPPPGTVPMDKSTVMITHCQGGGRGGKAKNSLLALGYTNVLSGGGPQKPELWAVWAGPLPTPPGATSSPVAPAEPPAAEAAILGSARLTMWLLMAVPWLACHCVRRGMPLMVEFIVRQRGRVTRSDCRFARPSIHFIRVLSRRSNVIFGTSSSDGTV